MKECAGKISHNVTTFTVANYFEAIKTSFAVYALAKKGSYTPDFFIFLYVMHAVSVG